MSEDIVHLKVEKMIYGQWEEILNLLTVKKGERFRIYCSDGLTIARQGTASADAYLNDQGFGQVEFEYGAHEGDCCGPYNVPEMDEECNDDSD